MGSPVTLVSANIFLDAFETVAFESSCYSPNVWLRYADDTYIIWHHDRDSLQNFCRHLNTQHSDNNDVMKLRITYSYLF